MVKVIYKFAVFAAVNFFLMSSIVLYFNNEFLMFADRCTKDIIPSEELRYLRQVLNDSIPSKDEPLPTLKLDSLNDISGEPVIPKIIHQTWKTTEVPEGWKGAQQSCIDLHPDYEYILWTDEMSRNFIADNYPWFLPYFDAYPFNVQRADVIRYFVLYHYGGNYIDLDDGCRQRLDSLLYYPVWVRRTDPVGVSNDVMGSVPHHPYFELIIQNLEKNAKSYWLPYLTIMLSTGPLSISFLWEKYKRQLPNPPAFYDHIRVLLERDYKFSNDSYFTFYEGSSWHNNDAGIILWANRHLAYVIVAGFCLYFILSYIFFSKLLDSRYVQRFVTSKRKQPTLPLALQEDV